MESKKNIIKVVLIGDSCIGKSSLCNAICKGLFIKDYKEGVYIDYNKDNFNFNSRKEMMCISLYDSEYQTTQSMIEMFVKSNYIIIFCYNSENYITFIKMKKRLDSFLSKTSIENKKNIIVVATKVDSKDCYINYEKDGKEFSELHGVSFIKTSIKIGCGIKEITDLCLKS